VAGCVDDRAGNAQVVETQWLVSELAVHLGGWDVDQRREQPVHCHERPSPGRHPGGKGRVARSNPLGFGAVHPHLRAGQGADLRGGAHMVPVGMRQQDDRDVRRIDQRSTEAFREDLRFPRLTRIDDDAAFGFEHVASVEAEVDGEDPVHGCEGGDDWEDSPSCGRIKFAVVDVSIESILTGTPTITVNPFDFRLRDSAGRTFDPTLDCREPSFSLIAVSPGQTVRGWITYKVPGSLTQAGLLWVPDFNTTINMPPPF
jgi:hypothetical protein